MDKITLLIISMVACLAGGILKKYSGNQFKNKQLMYQFFNAALSLASAISLFVMGGIAHISVFTLLLGIVFGIITALQLIFSLKAYETGPFAYTSVIVSLSMIIPTLSGHFIWGESITLVQIGGIILMLVCIICSVDFNKEKCAKKSPTSKWLIYALLAFICTGLIGIIQKLHQNSVFKTELNGFLIIAFAISFVYSLVCLLISDKNQIPDKRQLIKSELNWKIVIVMVVCGICAALNNKINLYLSGVIDSAIFFPIMNGSNLILTAVASVILFKEKLNVQKWSGIAIGIISVILLCNPF